MRKLKITSLILVAVMLVGMLPLGMLSATATTTSAPATLPEAAGGAWSYTTTSLNTGTQALSGANAFTYFGDDIGYRWRGAAGFLLQIDASQAAGFSLRAQIPGGAFGYVSYMQISMAQHYEGMPSSKHGALTSDAYLWDGTIWTKQQTTNLTTGKSFVEIPAGFSGYLYVPFDQLFFHGNGGHQSTNNDTNAFFGATALEFLSVYDTQKLARLNARTDTTNALTVNSASIVYADKGLAPDDGDVSESLAWTAATADNDSGGINVSNVVTGNTATYTGLRKTNVAKPYCWMSGFGPLYDLTDANGVSVHVDASQLGSTQLNFRMNLQYWGGVSDTPYCSGMIVHATGNSISDGKATNFYNSYEATESYLQFVTRTAGSVAYLRADGSNTWTAIYPSGGDFNGADGNGYYQLPAGFKGDVYIPMDSYWLSVLYNYSSPILIPFEDSLVKSMRGVGFVGTLDKDLAEGETNAVTYSGLKVWKDNTQTDTIRTEAELLHFFNNLNEYAGRRVVLANDIILNEGWEASQTAPAVKLNERTSANNYFSGTFDGQGHVISGLYLQSALAEVGFFGNVKTGTQATVKNVTIVNSYIYATNTADADDSTIPAIGSIFGNVQSEVGYGTNTWIEDAQHKNVTSAKIENVYADVDIKSMSTQTGGQGTGAGGFVGVLASDLKVIQSIFAGTVTAGVRGTAAIVGAIYPPQIWGDYDHDGATRAFSYCKTCDEAKSDAFGCTDNAHAKVTKYYKNNDTTARVEGTSNETFAVCEANLTVIDCIFTGAVVNTSQGYVGGVVGYANPPAANITIHDLIITGSLKATGENTGNTGWIYGRAWSSTYTYRTGGDEWQDWHIFGVTVVDDATDQAEHAFGGKNGSLRVWVGDMGYDFNGDGKYDETDSKYKTLVQDIDKAVTKVAASALPNQLLVRETWSFRQSVSLTEDLTLKLAIPVGDIVLAPGKTLSATAESNGETFAVTAVKSADGAYWEFVFDDILPQEMDVTYRVKLALTSYDNATVKPLTRNDTADLGSISGPWTSVKSYLNTVVNSDLSAEVKALARDLLSYGAAAQDYCGMKVTVGTVGTPDYELTAPTTSITKTEGSVYTGMDLMLENGLILRVGVNGGEGFTATVGGKAVTVENDGELLTIALGAAQLDDAIVITDSTGAKLTLSVNAYIYTLLRQETLNAKTATLLRAIYEYGMSARAYVNA